MFVVPPRDFVAQLVYGIRLERRDDFPWTISPSQAAEKVFLWSLVLMLALALRLRCR